MTDEIPEALKRNIESPRSTDRESRVTALSMALSSYTNTTVSPREILSLASHYADFIINGEVEWGDEDEGFPTVKDMTAPHNAR